MQETPGIQIADLIAWSFVRRLQNEPNDRWARLASTLLGGRFGSGVLTCTQMDPITEDIMRSKYTKKVRSQSA
jgi:hypothetical protein